MEMNEFTEQTIDANSDVRLVFNNISHNYDGLASVRNVSLAVNNGEILCLLGDSGCGKTTLLRIAAGIERESEGCVIIGGREVSGPKFSLPPEKRNVGLMFQDYALFPHMNILDNVRFGLSTLSNKEATLQAVATLERMGLGEYLKDYPHVLSGGEQQRVALARALAPQPNILLMDEPFNGLDKRLRDHVRGHTLELLRQSGTTSIIVTHDPEEAMQVADRIALMRSGRIVQFGKPGDIYLNPVNPFVARFFSEINEIRCVVSNGIVNTPFGKIHANGLADGVNAWVGIRPHDFEISDANSGIRAKVVEHRFLGEVDHVDLQMENDANKIRLRLPSRQGQEWPEHISLKLKEERVLLFDTTSFEN